LIDPAPTRPVPRWLHVWAILTVVTTAVLLVLGGFVTTFRVGMADPVWPTEPWYLASNYKLDFGYRLEHFHRILGWLVGGLGLVLAFGAWAYEPRKSVRWFGLAALVAMILAFAAFHGVVRMAPKGEEGGAVIANAAVMGLTLVGVLWAAGRAARGGGTGGLVRLVVALGMLAGMIQGLLGGLRVRYDDLFGREMSAVHGTFAVIVFGLLIATAVLTAAPKPGPPVSPEVAGKLRWQTAALVGFTFIQIGWGAWIRHFPGPLSNRLHLFFAFVVVGFATLAIKQAMSDPAARARLKVPARFLMGLITLQVVLGIEAWQGKFLTGTLPELEVLTSKDWDKALTRTAHAHVGAWVLAVAVVFAILARRGRPEAIGPEAVGSLDWQSGRRFATAGARSAP
jgi:heme a synthase